MCVCSLLFCCLKGSFDTFPVEHRNENHSGQPVPDRVDDRVLVSIRGRPWSWSWSFFFEDSLEDPEQKSHVTRRQEATKGQQPPQHIMKGCVLNHQPHLNHGHAWKQTLQIYTKKKKQKKERKKSTHSSKYMSQEAFTLTLTHREQKKFFLYLSVSLSLFVSLCLSFSCLFILS